MRNFPFTDYEIKAYLENFERSWFKGFICVAGHDPRAYKGIGKLVKDAGFKFHSWITTLVQPNNPELKSEWFVLNRPGESAYDIPTYISGYQFVCPNKNEVYNFLSELYGRISDIEEVDGVPLDYIRFPDVILPCG